MQDRIDLVRATQKKAKLLHKLQEKILMPLYEKCGFIRIGADEEVNDKMSLINYEKTCVVSRRFQQEDAENVSSLAKRNFIEVNSKDYGIKAMQKLADRYNAVKVASIAEHSHMYVFEWNEQTGLRFLHPLQQRSFIESLAMITKMALRSLMVKDIIGWRSLRRQAYENKSYDN